MLTLNALTEDEQDIADTIELANSHWMRLVSLGLQRDEVRLHALYQTGFARRKICIYPAAFDVLAKRMQAKGDFPETRLIDLITRDPETSESTLTPERRAEYAAAACWFDVVTDQAEMGCEAGESRILLGVEKLDPDDENGIVAIAMSRKHPVTQIAAEYRQWATKNTPKAFGAQTEAVRQAAATRAMNRQKSSPDAKIQAKPNPAEPTRPDAIDPKNKPSVDTPSAVKPSGADQVRATVTKIKANIDAKTAATESDNQKEAPRIQLALVETFGTGRESALAELEALPHGVLAALLDRLVHPSTLTSELPQIVASFLVKSAKRLPSQIWNFVPEGRRVLSPEAEHRAETDDGVPEYGTPEWEEMQEGLDARVNAVLLREYKGKIASMAAWMHNFSPEQQAEIRGAAKAFFIEDADDSTKEAAD